ncbi:5-methylcytosine-specific restriction endonuclease McrA [Caulobacter sp. BE264]|uniref:hypothetical protein n=1 Tax=Caulobacter sp. BE264 TaxID=2817724 RepID=UPI002866CAAD|nr:hypothetical protein [Caulobacter sp. BE264]MDR7230621.1 5-methylcytosine-specific restriction endonuclease McrA [Caulobacter sp. BE264]
MPSQPRIFRPGGSRSRADARRAYDATRRDRHAWRAWYGLARWHRIRARQLRDHPLCALCEEDGLVVPATVCDHVEQHGGDEEKFWSGPFQSLCKPCHDRRKQAEEAAARRAAPRPRAGGGASKV